MDSLGTDPVPLLFYAKEGNDNKKLLSALKNGTDAEKETRRGKKKIPVKHISVHTEGIRNALVSNPTFIRR